MLANYMNWSSIKSHRTSNMQKKFFEIKRPCRVNVIPTPTSLPPRLINARLGAYINERAVIARLARESSARTITNKPQPA